MSYSPMQVCAVIPAAGTGSRLGSSLPKILQPVTATETVWSILRKKLIVCVDHTHVVISAAHAALLHATLADDITAGLVSVSIQAQPIGMGDAIFNGYSVWSQADSILILWGDQVFVSLATLQATIASHGTAASRLTLPLTRVAHPYVEYVFDATSKLITVKQTREGDSCMPGGLGDVGTFQLSVGGLWEAWQQFLTSQTIGAQTHEINFLPFMPFLAVNNWQVQTLIVADATEARGINTRDNLTFFQTLYQMETHS